MSVIQEQNKINFRSTTTSLGHLLLPRQIPDYTSCYFQSNTKQKFCVDDIQCTSTEVQLKRSVSILGRDKLSYNIGKQIYFVLTWNMFTYSPGVVQYICVFY